MATTSDISRGAFIRYNNELLNVLEYDHITPEKETLFILLNAEMWKQENKVKFVLDPGEKIDLIRVDDIEMQYLFTDGEYLVCMNQENFEQVNVPSVIFGDSINYLQEGMILNIRFDDNEKPLSGNLPKYAELVVTYTEDGVKGKSSKSAEVEGGIKLQVPVFVAIGDKIKINIEANEYVERIMK